MGGLDEEPLGSPVRYPGMPTHLVPPTRLASGVRLNKPTDNEVTMTTPSKVTSPRRTRKTKSAIRPNTTYLSPERIRAHSVEQLRDEINHFIQTATDAEMKIIGHLNVRDCGGMFGLMKEIRRLLGESIAQCKVIPFPAGSKLRRSNC